ncbi:uncharacterized protein J3D65DRAFT_70702 [Phyllosticta citribraziliensis]|uniref:Uncharacterized protein n=1 Tax=Phyllosticta citribraziliensis TaxID=989973 RepID=A0ABR1LD09_9PEZI
MTTYFDSHRPLIYLREIGKHEPFPLSHTYFHTPNLARPTPKTPARRPSASPNSARTNSPIFRTRAGRHGATRRQAERGPGGSFLPSPQQQRHGRATWLSCVSCRVRTTGRVCVWCYEWRDALERAEVWKGTFVEAAAVVVVWWAWGVLGGCGWLALFAVGEGMGLGSLAGVWGWLALFAVGEGIEGSTYWTLNQASRPEEPGGLEAV